MTVYPFGIDSDANIIRIDDDISELGSTAINQLRDAVFAIEKELGIQPAGSVTSLANRLNVSLNADGTIKASALTSVGLATLPITNSQVATNAGIQESKLDLDYATGDLNTLVQSNLALLTSLTAFANITSSNLNSHIAGATTLANGSTLARHVASQIDINSTPSDSRDSAYVWDGLKDKDGVARGAGTVAEALDEINTDLTSHENATADAHNASAIIVDVSDFKEIPTTSTDAQKVFDYLDQAEVLNIGNHRATQHANGIPSISRSQSLTLPDGYRENVVPPTACTTYLIHSPNVSPVDDLSIGDDIIKFVPSTGFVFDSQFTQVKVGDVVRVHYSNGLEARFPIDSIRYVPGSEYVIRINGVNLCDGYGIARIDRQIADRDTSGVLAVAAANATPTGSFTNILSSVIVGHPRGASALGLGFDPNQLDSTHYKLYLEFYPTGDPTAKIISLPYIDVTGNAGATPGKYTLDSVVHATNNALRKIGYNYRLIAYAYQGEFGLMVADAINNASFSVIKGTNSAGTLSTGAFTENVIGGSTLDTFDALGLGTLGADIASVPYQTSFSDATAAQLPTKVIVPLKRRYYIANGQRRDDFAATYEANDDGYWDGYISARNVVGAFTVETSYTVSKDLKAAGLQPGKTIVVQPAIALTHADYSDVDYGRFIIKSVSFTTPCGSEEAETLITVINGIHAAGTGVSSSGGADLPVRLYFSEDSVGFNIENVINQTPTSLEYHRLHEIYVTDEGKTFSHERARMPRQTEDSQPSFLGTEKFHIKAVSPKLRGYRDSSPIEFNKYIRFFVLSYNSTTGEYDGYLGQRPSSSSISISKPGNVVTGRKNTTTRFYDETNVDWIEVEFEDGASPGTSILSTSIPRFVDIELFPSLQEHDEFMLLATCEVNWDPGSGQDIIQHVKDARQFGSIDESDFTSSAIDFISAADKNLHENGIIRGYNFDSINTSDNREISFKGGVALVNGKIVTSNNESVTIPQISPNGSSLPQTVTWVVCVNESGNLIPILLTSTKQQYFATPGSGNYYVPSVTFAELINTRKDLCPIYIVTATIASVTITSANVKDVRRFTANQGLHHPLVVAGTGFSGNFTTFEAAKTWISNYGSRGASLIRVRGSLTASSVDLTGLTSPVIFEGDGTDITVTSGPGFLVGSNVTFRNLRFSYDPVLLSYSSTDRVNAGNTGSACIYIAPDTTVQDITIENCTFICSLSSGSRPAFINVNLNKGDIVDNLVIRNNTFIDGDTTAKQAAIAIISQNDGGSSESAVIANSVISGNTCNQEQGIFVTTTKTIVSSGFNVDTFARPGLNSINVTIERNNCGSIGFITSSIRNTTLETRGFVSSNGLSILNNTCNFIGALSSTGVGLGAGQSIVVVDVEYGTGNVIIDNNKAKWIHCISNDDTTNAERSSLKITNNCLNAYDSTHLTTYYSTLINAGILVIGEDDEKSSILIANNNISFGKFPPVTSPYSYERGIELHQSGTITGNVIEGIAASGYHISLSPAASQTARYMITNNMMYRGSTSITAYINNIGSTSTSASIALITNNFFDSATINGSSTALVLNSTYRWTIHTNKNQTVTKKILGNTGFASMSIGGGVGFVFFGNGNDTDATTTVTTNHYWDGLASTSDTLQVQFIAENFDRSAIWDVPLYGIVPEGAMITSVSVPAATSAVFGTSRTLTLQLDDIVGTVSSDSYDLSLATSDTLTLTASVGEAPMIANGSNRYPKVRIYSPRLQDATGKTVTVGAITVTYIW